MILRGDDSYLNRRIVDYQFPRITQDKWDSNWLIIDGSVRLNGRDWNFREPCLTNFEAAHLADWLDACAQGKAEKPYCNFTEPNIQFDLVEPQTMRVSFTHESSPPWAELGDDWTMHGFNFPVEPVLHDAASDLRSQLQHFPLRGGRT